MPSTVIPATDAMAFSCALLSAVPLATAAGVAQLIVGVIGLLFAVTVKLTVAVAVV